MRFGARHASTANCSSSGLRSRSRASPSTWSNDGCHPARDGEPSCTIMLQTWLPWTYLLSRPLASTCSMLSSSFGSRDLVWIKVTAHPTAEWVARQITEAFPWNEVPRYMIRDRDCTYGAVVTRRLRA